MNQLGEAAREAGAVILEVVRKGFTAEKKTDASPVTDADHASEAVLLDALRRFVPDVPVVAEEQVEAGNIPPHEDTFFLVDALDGTKAFVEGRPDYTVNIGLIENGVPTLGVIFAPASGKLHLGRAGGSPLVEVDGQRRAISTRDRGRPLVALTSRSHFTQGAIDYLERAFPGEPVEREEFGSSLKFTILAEGQADIYPRVGPTSEWDTAAGHAILLAAGGRCDGMDGTPLQYGKKAYLNPGFCATGGWKAPAINA
ncbi:MAG: 3'(2'),5'-bisphosphate nucleotidase CysQ [Sphingomonas sp.]|nr:3'(2'),5'-bisphosphate nucleotidase CysQ [Sphingomonas sp.]RZV51758.1 MAG: 3'(2'),5'-bisphosphate nucleotidase [Sphingomonadaceae bacterium]